jgi:hypothetical protein
MSKSPKYHTTARCTCASVELQAIGAPITSVACYCDDCQEGCRQIEALLNAHPVRDPDGGTAYVLYRKDRVECSKGAQFLQGYKIREKSATNRVVATCCNSAMFMNFDDSKHWVPVYRARFQGDVPPLQMRICTKFKPENSDVPSDVRGYSTFPFRFVAKLVTARIAMLLHR